MKCDTINIEVPFIQSGYLQSYTQRYDARLTECLVLVADLLDCEGVECDVVKTKAKLARVVEPIVMNFTKEPKRIRCQVTLCSCIIAEVYLAHRLESFKRFFHIAEVFKDEYSHGTYVRIDDSSTTPEDRLANMVQSNAIGFDVRPAYSLSLQQLKNLLTYVFSADAGDRVEAKIRLLSTVSSTVRNDLITSPEKVLLASFREYFLTREEILHLLFRDDTDS